MNGAFARLSFARLYGAFMLLTGLICVVMTPPFQVPDEPNHFLRAFQVAQGEFVGIRRSPHEAGAFVPESLVLLNGPFASLPFAPQKKANGEMFARTLDARWTSPIIFWDLPNTVLYPPSSYIGAASGIRLARVLDSSPLGAFYLARLGNLLVNTLLGMAALWLAGEDGALLLAVMILPMSVSLSASCSQDGAVIALTALGIALVLRLARAESSRLRTWLSTACGLMLGCVASAKAPYAALLLLPFADGSHTPLRYRLLAFGSGLAVFLLWAIGGMKRVMTDLAPPGVHAPEQIRLILHHPLWMARVTFRTLSLFGRDFIRQSIGVLGWLDTPLSSFFYTSAGLFLLLCLIYAVFRRGMPRMDLPSVIRLAGLAVLLAGTAGGIFAALYVTWTPVGKDYIEGVQGRYFLPTLLALAFLPGVPTRWNERDRVTIAGGAAAVALRVVTCAFMALCLVTLYVTLSNRFW